MRALWTVKRGQFGWLVGHKFATLSGQYEHKEHAVATADKLNYDLGTHSCECDCAACAYEPVRP